MSQNFKTSKSKPFTYLIGWSEHQKFYYGVRYGIGVTPETLWTSYFTSSRFVHAFREAHGEPDIIQVRRTFDDIMEAKKWERTVLRRSRVVIREEFLNQSDKPAPPSRKGAKHSAESREKMKGPLTEERRQKISATLKGTNQKKWLITTPETSFCIVSLDMIRDNNWLSIYNSFRYSREVKRGKLKGWKLELLE